MSSSKKVILGFLTFLPIILMIAYVVFFISFFTTTLQADRGMGEGAQPNALIGNISMMVIFIATAMIVSLGLLIYYLVHAVNNKKFDKNQRLMWILILILANGIGNIIYFFVEIAPRKTRAVEAATES